MALLCVCLPGISAKRIVGAAAVVEVWTLLSASLMNNAQKRVDEFEATPVGVFLL